MAIGICFLRTIQVLFDVQFVLLQTANGARAHISMPVQTFWTKVFELQI